MKKEKVAGGFFRGVNNTYKRASVYKIGSKFFAIINMITHHKYIPVAQLAYDMGDGVPSYAYFEIRN